jgi:hypothetical protein
LCCVSRRRVPASMAMTCRRLLRRPASAAVVSEAFDIPRE